MQNKKSYIYLLNKYVFDEFFQNCLIENDDDANLSSFEEDSTSRIEETSKEDEDESSSDKDSDIDVKESLISPENLMFFSNVKKSESIRQEKNPKIDANEVLKSGFMLKNQENLKKSNDNSIKILENDVKIEENVEKSIISLKEIENPSDIINATDIKSKITIPLSARLEDSQDNVDPAEYEDISARLPENRQKKHHNKLAKKFKQGHHKTSLKVEGFLLNQKKR